MAIGPCDFWRLAVDFELLDLHALSNVSAASTATNACVLQSANLRNLLQRKVEEEGNLESQNLRIDIGFEEMAALKHSLKIALHVYNALQNSLCFACRRSIPTEERRTIGLGYFKYGLCAGCFEALTTVCTEQDDTLAEQRCVALTDDGVHAAAMLLSAYRAGAGCRLSQADAAWVRNVIADSGIVRTSCLICFVKCHDGQPGFQRDKLSSLSCQCGPKSCQKPRRPSVAQRKKQLSSLDCVNLLDR